MPAKVGADKICRSLGGDYDYDDDSCSLPMPLQEKPRSIIEGGAMRYFILQIGIGVSTSILGIYFSVTLLPPVWWTAFFILAIVYAISVAMSWYKIGEWKEAFLRATISMVVIFAMAIIIGIIYYADITRYIDPVVLYGEPLAATIIAMPISTLLSIILIEPEKRKGDDTSNDFSGGATLAIFGKARRARIPGSSLSKLLDGMSRT